MMDRLRPLVAVCAVFVLLVTAGMSGAARGQAKVAGEIVICSGQGAVTLTVDADGNPTGPVHWCPDCVLTLLAAVAGPGASPAVPFGVIRAQWGHAVDVHAAGALTPPQARGPPLV